MRPALPALLILCTAIGAPAVTAGRPEDAVDFTHLLRGAERGDVRSQVQLGMSYWYGEHGGADDAEAHGWFRLAAEAEDPLALFYMGAMYERGVFLEPDTALARQFYARSAPGLREAANAGDPAAMANLGLLYNIGIGIRHDPDSAALWVERAAEMGDPRAQYYAGFYSFHGVGGEKDLVIAAEWLERAALGGCARAQALLGNLLYNGRGVARNIEEAKAWFSRAETHPSAAEKVEEGVYHYRGIPQEGDEVIAGLLPPRSRLSIREGDCGEACLWTLLGAWGYETTEIQINEDAGAPGRGLHSYELHRVLDRYGLDYRDTMGRPPAAYVPLFLKSLFAKPSPADQLQAYRSFLYDKIIASVRRGTPAILGVKLCPHGNPYHPLDHFILVVGYNGTTDEIIVNSHNQRERVQVSKLLDTTDGYSLVNRYGVTSAIYVPLPTRSGRQSGGGIPGS